MPLDTIVLLPAGMKPMHGGHLDLIKRYSEHKDVKEVRVLIGPAKRDSISQNLSLEIARFLTREMGNVKIIETTHPTPVTSLYKYMETVQCGNYAIGASKKGDDFKTVTKFVENFSEGGKYRGTLPECVNAVDLSLDFSPLSYVDRKDEHKNDYISASIVRKDIDNRDFMTFAKSYPNVRMEDIATVWNMIITDLSASNNLHMEHIEDMIFNSGLPGLVRCKDMLKKIESTLQEEKEEVKISVKYDGSPSVFMWRSFPGLPDNSIAIKGLFNKEPEIFQTLNSILHSGKPADLIAKLFKLFIEIETMDIPSGEIWQGDFMFDNCSLSIEDIQGIPRLCFQTNTLVYTPKSAVQYYKIKNAKIGIVVHTVYRGESLSESKCGYDINLSKFTSSKNLYVFQHQISHELLPKSDNFSIDKSITEDIDKLINSRQYVEVIYNENLVLYLKLFFNNLIKSETVITKDQFVPSLITYIEQKFDIIIKSKKKQDVIDKYLTNLEELKNFIMEKNDVLIDMLSVINKISSAKKVIIEHLEKTSTMDVYVKMQTGEMIKTTNEGYVISDKYGSTKIVDRREFSAHNFSEKVKKAWNNEKRTV